MQEFGLLCEIGIRNVCVRAHTIESMTLHKQRDQLYLNLCWLTIQMNHNDVFRLFFSLSLFVIAINSNV